MRPLLLALWGWLGCIALSGCHGRAYRDLYAENMAAEIRDLEDQLYEYDHQYKLLEQELEVLRQQNQVLKAATPPKRSLLAPLGMSDGRSEPRPDELPIKPEPMLQTPARQADSILEPGPAPQSSSPSTPSPSSSNSDELPPPSRPQVAPPADAQQNPPSQSAPATPKFPRPQDQAPRDNDFDLEELLPPTIDPGVATPPPLPPLSLRVDGSPLAPEDNLEMNLARIEIPTQRVSAVLAAGGTADASVSDSVKAGLSLGAADKPAETRVIELAFHPALSRAINMDERPGPDGLYLVLQPKNELGQMVPTSAELMVFALDPSREGEQAKIGRWEFNAADVQQKLQPIGSEQGIHLRLPWTGDAPAADRVIVFALYKFTNGRQVMGEKEISLSENASLKTVWAPRADNSDSRTAASTAAPSGLGSSANSVSQASFQAPPTASKTSSASAPPANKLPTATIHSNPLVRPAAGSSTRQPPPLP